MATFKHKYFYKELISGKDYGLFFKQDLIKGTVVHEITGSLFNTKTRDTVQIENGYNVYDPVVIWINHGFEHTADATIQRNRKDQFVTITDVKEGDQVLFDYTMNEDYISSPFEDFYTREMVEFGIKDHDLIRAGVAAGFSRDVVAEVVRNPPKLNIVESPELREISYYWEIYDCSKMFEVVQILKGRVIPTTMYHKLFGTWGSLIQIFVEGS